MINKVALLGRVGNDLELTKVGENQKVSISLATSETYKDKAGEKQTVTEWHNVVLWNKLAELAAKYVKKGNLIYISGKIKYSTSEKPTGEKTYFTNIIGNEIKFISSDQHKEAKAGDVQEKTPLEVLKEKFNAVEIEDDLPF